LSSKFLTIEKRIFLQRYLRINKRLQT